MSTRRRWIGNIMVAIHWYGEPCGLFVVSVRDDALVFWPAPTHRETSLPVVYVDGLHALGFI